MRRQKVFPALSIPALQRQLVPSSFPNPRVPWLRFPTRFLLGLPPPSEIVVAWTQAEPRTSDSPYHHERTSQGPRQRRSVMPLAFCNLTAATHGLG